MERFEAKRPKLNLSETPAGIELMWDSYIQMRDMVKSQPDISDRDKEVLEELERAINKYVPDDNFSPSLASRLPMLVKAIQNYRDIAIKYQDKAA